MNINRGRNAPRSAITQLVCVAWLVLAGGSAQAATINWSSTTGGDYTNGANWTGGNVPGAADSTTFNLNASYTINITSNITNNNADFEATTNGGPVTLNLGTNTLTYGGASSPFSVSSSTGTNTVIVTGGTLSAPSASFIFIADGAGSYGNVIMSNATLNTSGALYIGRRGFGTLNMYNVTSTVSSITIGSFQGTANMLIAGSNSTVISRGEADVGYENSASSTGTGTLTVASGTFIVNGQLYVGNAAAGTNIGTLNIINGLVIVSNNFTIGYGSIGSGTVLLSGPNAKFFATNSASSSGISASPMPSQLVISNGTCMIGGAAPYFFVGSASFGKGVLTMSGGALTIVGSTATLVANPASSRGEIWLLGNGNPVLNAKDITLSGGSGSSGKMVVSNGTVSMSGTLSVGSATGTGTVYVANGAVLEAPAYSVNSASQNTVSNMGGVFQYTNASPSITPGTFGNVGIQNGTISFRAITNADVLCNQGTKPLDSTTKMLWVTGGSNTFRLNNATNSGTINQSYTFAPGTATNFARLELVNGSTCRNGSVTIGAGGSLYVSSGASTLSSVLTAAPSSTIEFDLSNSNAPACLLSTTNMYLNNCTLQLDLANPPIINTQFMIISNTLASQLSYSFAGSSTKQTFTLNGTNYLTSISLAGGGTKVVVQTMIPPYGTSVFFRRFRV